MHQDGHIIPQGTTISANHWAVHRDASYYGPNVEDFDIDRWLTPDGELKTSMKHFQFGFGRRVCPGQHIANQSVLINTANLLWAFDISKERDAEGKEVEIDTLAFTNTANSHPLPFRCSFKPRIEGLRSVLDAETM